MTLEWIQHEIREAECAPNSAKAVYDLAALLIVRDHMVAEKSSTMMQLPPDPEKMPTLDQVEKSLARINVSTADDRRRVQGLTELAKILK